MDMDAARADVVIRVRGIFDIGSENQVDRFVVAKFVVKHLDIGIGHDQHAGSCRDQPDDIALGCEIGLVVALTDIVEHPYVMAALLRQIGQVEHQYPASIPGQSVVKHIGIVAVLDLQPCHVLFTPRIAHDDPLALADVNPGIRGPPHDHAVQQHIARLHRVEPITAILGLGSTGPLRPDADRRKPVDTLGLDRVALGILDREILQNIAIASHHQPFGPARLALERQDRGIHPRPPQGHLVI